MEVNAIISALTSLQWGQWPHWPLRSVVAELVLDGWVRRVCQGGRLLSPGGRRADLEGRRHSMKDSKTFQIGCTVPVAARLTAEPEAHHDAGPGGVRTR